MIIVVVATLYTLVGGLHFVSIGTRPDLALGILTRKSIWPSQASEAGSLGGCREARGAEAKGGRGVLAEGV